MPALERSHARALQAAMFGRAAPRAEAPLCGGSASASGAGTALPAGDPGESFCAAGARWGSAATPVRR